MKNQKKKLTKKQLRKLERERKAEEERRAEEERLKREEKERVERERIAEEKRMIKEAYRTEEAQRLQNEDKNYFSTLVEIQKMQETVQTEYEEQEEWKRYLSCEEEFDLRKEKDLNLMLVLADELPLSNAEHLQTMLVKLREIEEIVEKVDVEVLGLKSRGQGPGFYPEFKKKVALFDKILPYIIFYIPI